MLLTWPAALVDFTADMTIYALAAGTGSVKWSFKTGGPVRSSAAFSTDGDFAIGSDDGSVYYRAWADGTARVSAAVRFSCNCGMARMIAAGNYYCSYCCESTPHYWRFQLNVWHVTPISPSCHGSLPSCVSPLLSCSGQWQRAAQCVAALSSTFWAA